MSGPRPSSGRPNRYIYNIGNKTYHSLNEAATCEGVSKMTITRWCKGGRADCDREEADAILADAVEKACGEIVGYSEKAKIRPLDFWLYILDHPEEYTLKERMQAGYYSAPYLHPKATASTGKKEQKKQAAQQASSGRFRPSAPPNLKMVSGINQKNTE